MFSKTFATAILAVAAQAEVKYFYTDWTNQRGYRHANVAIGSQDAQDDPVLIDFEADRLDRGIRGHEFRLDFHETTSKSDWDERSCAPKAGKTSTVTTLATETADNDLLRFQVTSGDFDLHEPEISSTSTPFFFVLTDTTDSELIACGQLRESDDRSYGSEVDKLEDLP